MSTSPNHPFVSSFLDRHGRERWRFRRAGKTVSLPGAPGEPAFEAAYAAALEGRKPTKAEEWSACRPRRRPARSERRGASS